MLVKVDECIPFIAFIFKQFYLFEILFQSILLMDKDRFFFFSF